MQSNRPAQERQRAFLRSQVPNSITVVAWVAKILLCDIVPFNTLEDTEMCGGCRIIQDRRPSERRGLVTPVVNDA